MGLLLSREVGEQPVGFRRRFRSALQLREQQDGAAAGGQRGRVQPRGLLIRGERCCQFVGGLRQPSRLQEPNCGVGAQ